MDATKTEAWNLGKAHSLAGRPDESNYQNTYAERCDYLEGYRAGVLEKAYIAGRQHRVSGRLPAQKFDTYEETLHYHRGFDDEDEVLKKKASGEWRELEEHEVPKLKSAVDLAYEKGVEDHDDGMDCCAGQYNTQEMRMAYLEGYQTRQREANEDVKASTSSSIERNSISSAVVARLSTVHKRGMDDALSGMSGRAGLYKQVEYATALERDLYAKGFAAGRMIVWGAKGRPDPESLPRDPA